jgi:prepilin-type N-terminal cleavage/methylation domain-containing protein
MGITRELALTKIKRMLCMSKKLNGLNQNGFTLIELISVMIIMGVVASVSIQKFDIVSDTASERALYEGIKELNIRESLVWSNNLYLLLDTNLGASYVWAPNPPDRLAGGTLSFKSVSIALNRQESTTSSAGKWE